MLIFGLYGASVLLVSLVFGGALIVWWAPLLWPFFPFLLLSPLAIPSLMVVILSAYIARRLRREAYPPPKTPASIPRTGRGWRAWKKTRPALLPIVMIALATSFYYFTYTADYNAVQSITVSIFAWSRQSSINPPTANFTTSYYINTLHPSTEETKIVGATFSLLVDNQPAGTITVPYDMGLGSWDTRDIADQLQFDMTGTGAESVLQHNPNMLILTVHFSAQGLLYKQDITKTFTIQSYHQTQH